MSEPEPIFATTPTAHLVPTCDHCGRAIVLEPRERDCCHKITLDYHAMQTDSARNSARHIVWLTKANALLAARLDSLEEQLRILTEPPAPKGVKGKA